jgi:glycosyltransferase involved in cell wall biosynthesis
MNIIYVGDCGPKPSGAPISCDQLTRALACRGWRVRVLAPALGSGDPDLAAFDAARPEIDAHYYPVPQYFFNPFERPPAAWEDATRTGIAAGLEQMIDESRPDAMLVRELWLPYANGAATRHKIPSVAMVRGNPTSAILADVFPADLAKPFLGELRKADRIVTVARHFLPGLGELGFTKVTCIPNAIDVARFAPRPRDRELADRLGIIDADIVALHASQIRPIKRPLDIVRAAREVLRRNRHVLYLIVGEGMSRAEMQALAAEYGVLDRFRFEPFVDNSQMPRYMNLADLVVMPSEREGLSRVYLEAQACAKTLVASDIAGAREVVTHGETGLLFRKAEIEDQVEKTLLAAENPALRAEIGSRARRYVERHHNIEKAVDEYMALLQLQCER